MKKVKIYLFCRDRLVEWEINNSQDNVVEFVLDKSITMFSRNYTVRFEFKDGNYKFESSHEMIIVYKDQNVKSRVLTDEDVLVCNFPYENSKIVLLVQFEDEFSHVFGKFSLVGFDKIKVGKSQDNNIVYDNPNVSDYHFVLNLDGKKSLEVVDGAVGCYLNKVKIDKSNLKIGDVIFLYGLKCVYLDKFIAVNNPNQNVYLNLPGAGENEIANLLPRKFTSFKSSTNDMEDLDSDEEKSIIINPPNIDLNFKFKFLYLGVIPFAIAAAVLIFLGVSFRDIYYMAYAGVASAIISILSLIFGITVNKSKINRRIKNYRDYLESKSKKLTLIRDEKVRALSKKYPKVIDCYEGVINFDKKLWNRNISDKDFLNLTIGQGNLYFENLNVKSNVVSNLSEEHELYKDYAKVTNNFRVIRKAPITISLRDINKIAVVGDMNILYDVVKNFLVQLTSLHSYRDLKIAILNSKGCEENLNYVKEIPHIYSDKKDFRYISSSDEEMVNVIYNVKNIILEREATISQNPEHEFSTNYVIFVFYDFNPILDSFLDYVKRVGNKVGVSFILVTIHDKSIPDSFKYILDIKEDTQTLYKVQDKGTKKLVLSHEYTEISNLIDIDKFVNELSKIKIFGSFEEIKKFEDKSLFNMYGISKADDLDIISRWNKNNLLNLRDVPVGVNYDRGIFSINLHTKHNGPNGIIFGDSGTGKTEFLRSFILSYCVNFHPNSFNFIIVRSNHNIKLNSFVDMPHVTDILDKENKSELNRLVLLIKNEINKRQLIFDSMKVRDINDYLNVYKNYEDLTILPYITIVVDDVCENDIGFIKELIDVNMSSVGIHLVVSTNDADSFVEDRNLILSKFDFKVCFRLSNLNNMFYLLGDSNVSNPRGSGLFNVKFSNQSVVKNIEVAFSNVEQDIENSNENLDIINNCGLIIKKISRVRYLKDSKIQQDAIIEKINEICNGIELRVMSIFNSSLRYLNLQELAGYSSNFNGFMWCESQNKCSAIIGIIDDPKYHVQRFLEINFENLGNLFVYGSPGTGKSTLLKTLVYSLCCEYKPSHLNVYMVDANTRSIDYFGYAPHVKDIAYTKDEINTLFKKVLDEFDLRRKIFENLDISSIENYKIKTGEQLPYIILVIDSVRDIMNNIWDYSNFIKMLARDGKSYGIFVCAVSSDYDDVEEKLSEYFNNKLVLRLNNKYLYKKILGEDCSINSKLKGRGIISYNDTKGNRILEFQIASPMDSQNDVDLNNKLKSLFIQMDEINTRIYEASYMGEMLDTDVNFNLEGGEFPKFLSVANENSLEEFILNANEIPKLTSIVVCGENFKNEILNNAVKIFINKKSKSYLLDCSGGNFKNLNSHWYGSREDEILRTINWISEVTLNRINNENFDLENEEKFNIVITDLCSKELEDKIFKIMESVFNSKKDIGIYFVLSSVENSDLQNKISDFVNLNSESCLSVILDNENSFVIFENEKIPVKI